jgi:hypothetical protein
MGTGGALSPGEKRLERGADQVKLLACITEVVGSNLSRKTTLYSKVFRGFTQSLQEL